MAYLQEECVKFQADVNEKIITDTGNIDKGNTVYYPLLWNRGIN